MSLLNRLIFAFLLLLRALFRAVFETAFSKSLVSLPTLASFIGAIALLTACGGGGGGGTSTSATSASAVNSSATTVASNAVAISVGNPIGGRRPNVPYVNVTLCVPGTTTCQTIDNVIVDTGSVGLRLLASSVSLVLASNTAPNGTALAECVQFADGYTWGSVRTADIKVGVETASALPVNIIADANTPTMPAECADNGGVAHNSISALGGNGILGIGQQTTDCGTACANAAVPMTYYACTGTNNAVCTATQLPAAQQVPNPITHFSSDNNGSVIVLPAVNAQGATSITGQLIFGIGTQSNNALGTATVIPTDSYGQFTVAVNGTAFGKSYLDSGSNSVYFSGLSISACSSNASFYCPSATLNYPATLTSNISTATLSAQLAVANADTLFAANSGDNNVLPGLAGPGFTTGADLGLPFFYGKSVFTAIDGAATPGGTGPYVAM